MVRRTLSLSVLLTLVLLADVLHTQAPTPEARVDRLFARWTSATPGCAVGATVDGKLAIEKAYGMADLEHDVRNTPGTIFEAGSVAKQFTAAAVLLLARDGKLSLDDAIRKYVPEVPDYGTPVTIRHMLTHTSGLRDWGSIAGIGGWPRGRRVHTPAHVLDIISRQGALNFTPGTRWSYSNSGYNLAAILVDRVSGMSFADFTRTRIFEPLAMTSTSWRDDHTRIVKGRAIAYSQEPDGFHTDMPFETVHGNGGLLTTVGDLLKWQANFAMPRFADAAFVQQQQERGRFTDGTEHPYAFGLRIDTYKAVREVAHAGVTAGYRAYLAWYPEHDVSVAVLCNAGSANAREFARGIADVFLGQSLKPDVRPVPPLPQLRGPLAALERDDRYKPLVQDLAPFVGTYRSDEAEVAFVVAIENDALVLKSRPDRTVRLRPRARDAFDAGGGIGAIVFRRDGGNQVTGLSVVQDRVWDLRFRRDAAPTATSSAK